MQQRYLEDPDRVLCPSNPTVAFLIKTTEETSCSGDGQVTMRSSVFFIPSQLFIDHRSVPGVQAGSPSSQKS